MSEKQKLVPKLRFPEFREAGEWSKEKLGAVATLHKGKGISKAEIVAKGVQPCIRYGELYTIYGETIHETASSTNVDASELFLSKKNDVIIPASGETKIDIAKASCVMKDDIALGGDLNVIRSSQNGIFLSYQLNGPLRSSIARVAQGDSVVHLYPTQIERLDVLVPSPPEQQKIADCLASLDELITLEAQKLDTLKTHKKGLMQQLFPAEGETLPKRRFPEFRDAGEWEISPLSKYVSSLDAGVSVVSGDRPARGGEVGILKTSAVTDGVFNPQENKLVFNKGELQRVKEPVTANSIIISRMNTPALVGANAYVSDSLENIFLPDRLWAAKPRRNTSMRYIAFVLGSEKGRAALSELATGTSGSMKNITKPAVLALEITAPSFAEQQKIADCLTSLDDLITAQTQQLAALKTHKKGLMQGLFPVLVESAV